VRRIDPAVNNGVVQVDVELTEDAPDEARPELSVEGTIQIAQLANALYVKRPMFAKRFGESTVYLVDANSNTASKHAVTFGQASTNYIEIKEGLSLGQSIIVSDVSAWDLHQHIQLN
jgi:multidrug efflux pump subunit AcrA (membrane-fusion protein)